MFVTGKDASKPKKDDFTRHAKRPEHTEALSHKSRQKDFAVASQNAYASVRDSVIAQMRNVLFLAKEHVLSTKAGPLIDLQLLNVSKHSTLSTATCGYYLHLCLFSAVPYMFIFCNILVQFQKYDLS